MIILNALLERLKSVGLISSDEKDLITDLHVLSSILEGKLKTLLNSTELDYVNEVNNFLEIGEYQKIREMVVPESFIDFHGMVVRSLEAIEHSLKPSLV